MTNLIFYMPLVIKGASITLAAWLLASIVSFTLGTLLGILSSNKVSSKNLIKIIRSYTFITKGIPAYVQILLFYFAIPALLGINIPGFLAASMALAICSSGYVTEIIRAGINSVPNGQWDACLVLGYSQSQTLQRVIMPQATRIVFPALLGEFEQLIKSTALLATIGVTEMTRAGMNIISRELNPLPVYLIIALMYLLFSALLNLFMFYIQKKKKI